MRSRRSSSPAAFTWRVAAHAAPAATAVKRALAPWSQVPRAATTTGVCNTGAAGFEARRPVWFGALTGAQGRVIRGAWSTRRFGLCGAIAMNPSVPSTRALYDAPASFERIAPADKLDVLVLASNWRYRRCMNETQVHNLVKEWYQRARSEDPVSKFVFLWFCFNATLALESGEDIDTKMISWLKSSRSSGTRLRGAYDLATGSSTFQDHLSALVQLSPILSARDSSKSVTIKSTKDFPNVASGIYQVRCNLFHGAKSSSDVRDQKLIKACALILEK